jgi:hypothetical protein
MTAPWGVPSALTRSSPFQTKLLQDAVEGSRRQVIAWLARDRDATGFRRVLELAMAAPRGDQEPPVALKHPRDFADFHPASVTADPRRRDAVGTASLTGVGEGPKVAGFPPSPLRWRRRRFRPVDVENLYSSRLGRIRPATTGGSPPRWSPSGVRAWPMGGHRPQAVLRALPSLSSFFTPSALCSTAQETGIEPSWRSS